MQRKERGVYLPCEFVGGGEEKERRKARTALVVSETLAPQAFPSARITLTLNSDDDDLAHACAWREVNACMIYKSIPCPSQLLTSHLQ